MFRMPLFGKKRSGNAGNEAVATTAKQQSSSASAVMAQAVASGGVDGFPDWFRDATDQPPMAGPAAAGSGSGVFAPLQPGAMQSNVVYMDPATATATAVGSMPPPSSPVTDADLLASLGAGLDDTVLASLMASLEADVFVSSTSHARSSVSSASTPASLHATTVPESDMPMLMSEAEVRVTDLVDGVSAALSRPVACSARLPGSEQAVAFGTETQGSFRQGAHRNQLLVLRLDGTSLRPVSRVPMMSLAVREHVRDVAWMSASRILVADGRRLRLARMPSSQGHALAWLADLPDFHTGYIRELAVQPQTHLVLSGGFDGNVFATDIAQQAKEASRRRGRHGTGTSSNLRYDAHDAVGSVRWHPCDAAVASCTTDSGSLHIVDTRARPGSRSSTTLVCGTRRRELWTHAWVSEHTAVLGYGDGCMRMYDRRRNAVLPSWYQQQTDAVGDVLVSTASSEGRQTVVTTGHNTVTMWQRSGAHPLLKVAQAVVSRPFVRLDGLPGRTGATFLPGGDAFATTDSTGTVAVYRV